MTNVEFFEQLTQNLLYAWVFFGSLITILKSELENSKSRVRIAKFEMAAILVQILSFFAIAPKLGI